MVGRAIELFDAATKTDDEGLQVDLFFPAPQPQPKALGLKSWDVELNGKCALAYACSVKLQAYVFCDC
jgi:hypothetical protein